MAGDPPGLAPGEAAALLGLSPTGLRRLLARGLLPAGPDGRLPRAPLLAWRDRQAALRRAALAGLSALSETHDL